MIRLYRQFVEQIVLILLFLKDHSVDGSRVRDHVSNAVRNRVQVNTNVYNIVDRAMDTNPPDFDEMLVDLVNQLDQTLDAKGKHVVGDFIDQIVKILQLPWGKQYIRGGDMDALRKAILLPSEMSGLTGRIRQREMSCSGCHIPVRHGELVTISIDGPLQVSEIYCIKCLPPSKVACTYPGCDMKAKIHPNLSKMLSKEMDCGLGKSHQDLYKQQEAVAEDRISAEIAAISPPMTIPNGWVEMPRESENEQIRYHIPVQRATLTPQRARDRIDTFAQEIARARERARDQASYLGLNQHLPAGRIYGDFGASTNVQTITTTAPAATPTAIRMTDEEVMVHRRMMDALTNSLAEQVAAPNVLLDSISNDEDGSIIEEDDLDDEEIS